MHQWNHKSILWSLSNFAWVSCITWACQHFNNIRFWENFNSLRHTHLLPLLFVYLFFFFILNQKRTKTIVQNSQQHNGRLTMANILCIFIFSCYLFVEKGRDSYFIVSTPTSFCFCSVFPFIFSRILPLHFFILIDLFNKY